MWRAGSSAMGKMGAFELNYSSDIDLICLFDESRFAR
jgi:glutamate-ammonia-ligase adenylyltransferase